MSMLAVSVGWRYGPVVTGICLICLVFSLLTTPVGAADLHAIADRVVTGLRLDEAERKWLRSHQEIRVGIDADFAPFSEADGEGGFQGIVPDYLTILSRVLEVRFTPVAPLSWSEILNAAQDRRVDLVATATIRPARLAYLNFSDFSIPTPLMIMARRGTEQGLSQPEHLRGRRVAIVRNYAAGKRVMEEQPGVLPVMVETPLQGLQALSAGEVDAYVGVLAVNTYLARTEGLTNLAVAGRYDVNPHGQRFAVRKDWAVLSSILDKALAAIPQGDRARILEKWSVRTDTGESSAAAGPQLTREERAYMDRRGPVRMCVDPDWMPYERINEQGAHMGMLADYMRRFAELLDMDIELVPTVDWAESEKFARERKCDILSGLNKTARRLEFLNFSSPYVEAPIVVVARDDAHYLDGMSALNGRSVGIVRGYYYEDYIREHHPYVRIVYVDNVDDGMAQVSDGTLYATIGSLYVVTTRIQQLGLSNLKIAGHTQMRGQWRIGVRNDEPVLLQVLEKAVLSLTPQIENDILRRWVSVRIEHGVDYGLAIQVLIGFGLVVAFLLYRQGVARRHAGELAAKNAELERLSRTDALTGLNNRLALDETLADAVEQARCYARPLSVILIDIDFFKRLNDTYGHPVGDRVLKQTARRMAGNIRATDTLGRWGGEEFLIVCPELDVQDAVQVAEKLRVLIKSLRFDGVGDTVTASFGVAALTGEGGERQLIQGADQALYKAKNSGRDRTETVDAAVGFEHT